MISILTIMLMVGVFGFNKYNTMKNPHQAFEEDLKRQEDTTGEDDGDAMEESVLGKNVLNLLFLGVDSTETRETREMGYRSDTIMLVSMNLDTKKVRLLSIPRDSYTEVPGSRRKDKINHAMAFGGGPKRNGNQYAVEAVEGLLGIDVHYYVTMDLDAVKDVVDTIGDVTIEVERSMEYDGKRLAKGVQTLNGQQALVYLSNRNAPTGDFARIQQQQNFMMALFQQTKEKGKITDILPLYLRMQNKIFTDLNIEQIGALVLFLKDLNPKDIETFTLRGNHMFIEDIYYLDIDGEYMEKILNTFFS